MKNHIYTLLIFIGLIAHTEISNIAFAQETPGKINTKKILLIGAIAHIGNGEVINKSAIAIEGSKITFVKDALAISIDETKFDTIIRLDGAHLYPGFIAPNSTLGLTEIGAVRATNDHREVGTYNPHIRSITAYNTDSEITTTVRSNGILLAQITPRGGIISGTSSVVHFDAWNWEDATYLIDDGMHLNWPKSITKTGWWAEPGSTKKQDKYSSKIAEIETYFAQAIAYSKIKNKTEIDIRLAAFEGVLNGEKNLYIHASLYKEINDIVNFKKKYLIPNIVIIGGHDSYLLAKKLNDNNISVMLQRVHSLPERPEDDVYLPYKLPKLLSDANVLFCLENSGDMEQMGTRNLPFYAGTAIAHGMEYEKAVQTITLNTAKILGIEKQVGSIEVGKDATLFVSEGDALDMRTNNVTLAMIQGRFISLDNHQKRNYEKYKSKFELK